MQTEPEKPQPIAPEFAALIARADALDAGDTPAPEGLAAPQAAAPAVDPIDEAAALFGMVVALAAPALPYLEGIYTPDTLRQLAAAYVPVANKYGWTAGGFFEQFGAEITLAATVAPLGAATWRAHKAHVAEKRKAAAPAAAAAPQVTAAPATEDRGGRLMPA